MSSFNELLQASFKSNDTEEWLDVHFTRPIGLVFALFWNKFNVHPNAITVLSIFLGAAAGYMFYYPDTQHNIMGVVLLIFANFCDSTDGQMARLTGKKTLVGRLLDESKHTEYRYEMGSMDLGSHCCCWYSVPFTTKFIV